MSDSKELSSGERRKPPNAGKGRKKGTPNKFTSTVKEAVLAAFQSLQSDKSANLEAWAKANPTDFYKIASKLIPAAVEAEVSGTLEITEVRRTIVRPEHPNG